MSLEKPVGELTDAELAAALEQRRAARGRRAKPSARVQRALEAIDKRREAVQALANLELPSGATWGEIEARYREFRQRFDPEKHRANPDRYRAAQELVAGLERAYQVLSDQRRGS